MQLSEFNGENVHAHMLVRYPAAVQRSRLINSLKKVSSRKLLKRQGDKTTPNPGMVICDNALRGRRRGTFIN